MGRTTRAGSRKLWGSGSVLRIIIFSHLSKYSKLHIRKCELCGTHKPNKIRLKASKEKKKASKEFTQSKSKLNEPPLPLSKSYFMKCSVDTLAPNS